MIDIQPLDIILFNAKPYNIIHKLITWRSLDSSVHSVVVKNSDGTLYDPDFKGIVNSNLNDYKGRNIIVLRHKLALDKTRLLDWCENTMLNSKGYDYSQWILGFVLGLTTTIVNNPNKWTCAEFPYWMFQENGYAITAKEELLPMPRLFKYHKDFNVIFTGEVL
jgi:hypothetical protein